jgi:hypothetical protein
MDQSWSKVARSGDRYAVVDNRSRVFIVTRFAEVLLKFIEMAVG